MSEEQTKKKMIIFGNKMLPKDLSKEQVDYINSFDVIVRVNRMNNINQTGNRVDWWHPDICRGFLNFLDDEERMNKIDFSQISRIYLTKKVLKKFLIDRDVKEKFAQKCFGCDYKTIRQSKIQDNSWQYLQLKNQNSYWKLDTELKNRPTSTICLISHLVHLFHQEYDIYIFGIDLENREKLFQENEIWNQGWHRNVGGLEEKFLKDLISKGKIRVLEEDFKI